jgi:hypothetical protein
MVMLEVSYDLGPRTAKEVREVWGALLVHRDGPGRSVEMSRIDSPWPMLSILTHGSWCVLHHTTAQDGYLLTLESESLVDAPDELEFVYAGTPTGFTREYLNPLAVTTPIVQAFAIGAPWPDAARWVEL